jgi:glycosyltransferase involved in cell wall biosynthesis
MPESRTLVIPMFRESGRIESTLAALADASEPIAADILLVDDGSDDGTADIAEKAAADRGLAVQVLRLPTNRGKGAAVRAGVLAATGDTVVFADADLLGGAADIASCFHRLEAGEGDVVFATRSHPDSTITVRAPRHRVWIGRTYNAYLRALGLTTSRDTQCGLKGFTAEAARVLFPPLRTEGFAFDIELLARADRAGLRVTEMPIAWGHVQGSRVGAMDGVRSFLDALAVRRVLREHDRGTEAGAMDEGKFDLMARLEREHWWFRAKRRLVEDRLSDHAADRSGTVIDVGCGTGALVAELERGFARVVGTDLSEHAARLARREAGARPLLARAEALPFPDETATVLTSLDVVEHLDDDVVGLEELRRVIRPRGLLLLTVPAYDWAWSDHDVALGHRRRYTAARLRAATERAGFDVIEVSYFHAWLVPLAFVMRKTPLRRFAGDDQEEASFASPTVNRLLAAVTRLERALARHVRLPFGLSILLVARRGAGGRATS